uniref:Coiled-coil domain containing 78 n=1 Tax=Sinocyclocheilus grahami TaxID=75366 RepID=A0A672MWH3_SINGR
MLEEVKRSYRSREEQLTKAIRSYRKHIQGLSNTYQQLLAYRLQREQILALPEHALEARPPEAHFSPAGTELRGETDRELHRLREDKARLESQLKLAREQVCVCVLFNGLEMTFYVGCDLQVWLRRLLGSQEGRSNSARAHKPRPLHKSLKSSSYEI